MKNHTQNVVDKLFPDPFSKNSKSSISLDQYFKVILFLFFAKLRTIESDWNCGPLAFTSFEAFLKNKKRTGTSLPGSFSRWFSKKNVSLVIFYYLTKLQCLIAFTSIDIGQYVYRDCLLTRLWCHKSWN